MSAMALALVAAAAAPGDYSKKEVRDVVRSFGDCVVKRQHQKASEAIVANASNKELLDHYSSLRDGSCLPVNWLTEMKVQFVGDQFRYALADSLVRADFGNAPAPDFEKVPLLDHRTPSPPAQVDKSGKPLKPKDYEKAVEAYRMAQAFTFLSRYGECVVRTDPTNARGLLLTDPDSPDESAQFAALHDALGMCMPEGTTLGLGKLALRGTIAINYYRLAKAAASGVSE